MCKLIYAGCICHKINFYMKGILCFIYSADLPYSFKEASISASQSSSVDSSFLLSVDDLSLSFCTEPDKSKKL